MTVSGRPRKPPESWGTRIYDTLKATVGEWHVTARERDWRQGLPGDRFPLFEIGRPVAISDLTRVVEQFRWDGKRRSVEEHG